MIVTDVKKEAYGIYVVTLKPTWFERRILGKKEKTERYRDKGSSYMCGGQNVYFREDGSQTGNWNSVAEAIDRWRNKF